MPLTILLVEPEESLRDRVREALRAQGHSVWAFARALGAVDALKNSDNGPAVALLTTAEDPDMDRLLDALLTASTQCQRVWIAAPGDEEVDQLAVSRRPRGLLSRSELEQQACLLADRVYRTRERGRALVHAPPLVGESRVMAEVRDLIDRIAAGGATTVLITGETGTGKEVTARRLHALGPRGPAPFVEVDCASIPVNLMESELFGHEAGAFTDARETKAGLFELGQGGTAFLDEIGELDLSLQAKLLRVLDSRKLRRVGGREEIPLDVHLIAATNRDLAGEVQAKRFRPDLFYRLDVVRVELPAVREREEDAWHLCNLFLEEAWRRLGRAPLVLADSVKPEVLSYPWPGNVREIRNHMERLALLAPAEADTVTDLDLPSLAESRGERFRIDFSQGPVHWEAIERIVLAEALRAARGNASEAARLLGLGRGALRYRMARCRLEPVTAADPEQDSQDEDRKAA